MFTLQDSGFESVTGSQDTGFMDIDFHEVFVLVELVVLAFFLMKWFGLVDPFLSSGLLQ